MRAYYRELDALIILPPLPWPASAHRTAQPKITVRFVLESPPESLAQDLRTAGPPIPPSATQNISLEQAQYQAQSALTRQLLYPSEPIELGLEGNVTVLLVLDNSGRVASAEITSSSGHALLDAAALNAAKRLGRLPGNPRETLVPISFRLD